MKKGRWIWVATLLAVVALVGLAVTAQAAVTKVQINLTGTAANGKARFEDRGGEQRFRVELEDAVAQANTTVNVCLGGAFVDTMAVNAIGDGTLALNSDVNANTPASVAGLTLVVRTGACPSGGTLVASGAFP